MATRSIPQDAVNDQETGLEGMDDVALAAFARGWNARAAVAGNKRASFQPPEPGTYDYWLDGAECADFYVMGIEV